MSDMPVLRQSTNHIMMMEPALFHANPETKATNSYQHDDDLDVKKIHEKAVQEFRSFRDLLVMHGLVITTAKGRQESPDDIFCNNWVSTHQNRLMVLYPMLASNRQIERRPELIDLLKKSYSDFQDYSAYESQDQFLESTGALCMDRVNKIAYHARSRRADDDLSRLWCQKNGYELFSFDTDYKGKPVYHTDVVMWIGSHVAGICIECLKDRSVIDRLQGKHDVIEFSNEQMENFCGNSLQVVGPGGENMLVMSAAGYKTLTASQKSQLDEYYKTIITPEIPTIEYYGGGSARCMLLELF